MKKLRHTTFFLFALLGASTRRFKLSVIKADRKRYLAGLAIFALLAWTGLKFGEKVLSSNSLSQGMAGLYTTQNLPAVVTNLLSLPLVRLDKSGQPQPVLVSGWQVNNDATVYTFTLKDNLYWNDGTRLIASDIVISLPDVALSYPNDQTLEFKLADSFSPFPTLLTAPVFKQDTLTGLGKFKVADMEVRQNLVIKLAMEPQDRSYPSVTIRFYPDEKTLKTAFGLGEVESLVGVTETYEFENSPLTASKKIDLFNKIVAVFYNTKDPILSDKNLRLALSYGAPEASGEARAKTSLPPTSWAYNSEVKDFLGKADLAKGYLNRVKNGKDSQLTLTATPALASLAEKVAAGWRNLGLNVVVRIESGVPQNFQALLMAQPIPSDPDQYSLWHSTQEKTNLTKYSSSCCSLSARVDKDLEEGRKTVDAKTRKERYLDFQKVLLDDAPAAFLYFPKFNVIYRKKSEAKLNKILDLQIPSR